MQGARATTRHPAFALYRFAVPKGIGFPLSWGRQLNKAATLQATNNCDSIVRYATWNLNARWRFYLKAGINCDGRRKRMAFEINIALWGMLICAEIKIEQLLQCLF
jgi:hypothetical protein